MAASTSVRDSARFRRTPTRLNATNRTRLERGRALDDTAFGIAVVGAGRARRAREPAAVRAAPARAAGPRRQSPRGAAAALGDGRRRDAARVRVDAGPTARRAAGSSRRGGRATARATSSRSTSSTWPPTGAPPSSCAGTRLRRSSSRRATACGSSTTTTGPCRSATSVADMLGFTPEEMLGQRPQRFADEKGARAAGRGAQAAPRRASARPTSSRGATARARGVGPRRRVPARPTSAAATPGLRADHRHHRAPPDRRAGSSATCASRRRSRASDGCALEGLALPRAVRGGDAVASAPSSGGGGRAGPRAVRAAARRRRASPSPGAQQHGALAVHQSADWQPDRRTSSPSSRRWPTRWPRRSSAPRPRPRCAAARCTIRSPACRTARS